MCVGGTQNCRALTGECTNFDKELFGVEADKAICTPGHCVGVDGTRSRHQRCVVFFLLLFLACQHASQLLFCRRFFLLLGLLGNRSCSWLGLLGSGNGSGSGLGLLGNGSGSGTLG
jgi:hypothetical protein